MMDKWFRALKLIFISLIFLVSCESENQRKIKLSTTDSDNNGVSRAVSSVLQVLPQEQRSIAVLLFKNETGDASLDWLKRGLADMLESDLKQSPYLNVIDQSRLDEIAENLNKSNDYYKNPKLIKLVANEAQVKTILSGRYFQENGKLCIGVEIWDMNTTRIMPLKSVKGESLEGIFAMVNELSSLVRANLRGEESDDFEQLGVDFTQMTNSVKAFRCYSEALQNFDKLLYFEAEKCLKDAIELDTTYAAAYLRLANFKILGGKSKDGPEFLKMAKKYSHKLSEADQYRLQILETGLKGEYFESIELLRNAVNRFPSDIEFRTDLARYYKYTGDIDRSLEEFEIALDLDPNNKMIYNDLGYLYAERGEYTTAFKYFDKYQELAPDEANPYDSRGEILMRAGRFREAEVQLRKALEKWPNFQHSAFRLSELYQELGDYNQAVKYTERIINSPLYEDFKENIHFRRAMVHWRFGNIDKAIEEFKVVLDNNPLKFNTYKVISELYKTIGDTDRALKVYRSALSKFDTEVTKNKLSVDQIGNVVGLFLASDLPNHLSISFFNKCMDKEDLKSTDAQNLIDLALGLLYLRSGETEKAESYLRKKLDEKITLIAQNRQDGWEMWRFLFEAMDHELNTYKSEASFTSRLLAYAKENDRHDIEVMVNFGIARMEGLAGIDKRVEEKYQYLGSPKETDWQVIGPFAMENFSGFDYVYSPEKKIDVNVTHKSAGRSLGWQVADDGYFDGYIDLKEIFGHGSWSVAYGLVYIHSPEERKVQLRIGTNESVKLWLNNRQIWQHYQKRAAVVDRDLVTVLLKPGYNKLLVKLTNEVVDWGFFFRVTGEDGRGFKDITFHSYQEVQKTFAQK